ncbi:MAG: enoyl-CoA hydratase-related protein [Oleiphilaceae bacterium]|nr:enoyl-CoA hydratase-related protein [Oleiphilaceae bacterium]
MSDSPLVQMDRPATGIVRLILDDPATRNAISSTAMIDALTGALLAADNEDGHRVTILTGSGDVFCSGGDIKQMAARAGMFAGSPEQISEAYRQGIQRIPRTLARLRKPLLAAVNGPAYGAGCDLAMMCDLRVASDNARFAENFVRLGLVPGDGGAWFLPRVVGQARAAEMALTGEPVAASTALEWGMVSRCVPPDRLQETALELAQRISRNPPGAVVMTRQLLRESPVTDLETLLERSATLQGLAHQSPDHHEAVAALLEKRPPRFGNP